MNCDEFGEWIAFSEKGGICMSGLFIFGVIFLAVVCMVIAISKFNMHPFLVG